MEKSETRTRAPMTYRLRYSKQLVDFAAILEGWAYHAVHAGIYGRYPFSRSAVYA